MDVEEDRARLLRSPGHDQTLQQGFVVSSEAVEAEARANTMHDLQVYYALVIVYSLIDYYDDVLERYCGHA